MTASVPRRLVQLFAGLVLFGASTALMVASGLGLASWDVLHQGLARHTGLPLGHVVIGVGALVLLAWIPLRQRPGFGTAANVVVVGLAADATLGVLPTPHALAPRAALLVGGIALNGVATGLYVGAGLGPGPRDGLMTGLAARTGRSLRLTRTGIEVAVLAAGWLLGGTVGVGTVLFAAAIGPLAQFFIARFTLNPPGDRHAPLARHHQHDPSRTRRDRRRRLGPRPGPRARWLRGRTRRPGRDRLAVPRRTGSSL
ncbi:membrane protein YczE [Catenulispora acidiphila]|uniref:membrane protein YczE n=1 Tax=Catenulispora acidiphila TaxID=304895 RepID=UPI00019E00BE